MNSPAMWNTSDEFLNALISPSRKGSDGLSVLSHDLRSIRIDSSAIDKQALIRLSVKRMQTSETLRKQFDFSSHSIQNWLVTSERILEKDRLTFSDISWINQSLGGTGLLRKKNLQAEAMYVSFEKIPPFIDILNSQLDAIGSEISHEFLYALAFFSRTFASVHPFDDFNGRTLRMVIDSHLDRVGLPPVTYDSPGHFYVSAFQGSDYFPSVSDVAMIIHRGIQNSLKILNLNP